jgi:peptidyl-prolyl cis-trans isomerase B (cyclophilin B)
MKALNLICLLGLVAGIATAWADDTKTNTSTNASMSQPTTTPEVAIINTTEGTMVVQFWTDAAPNTIANFKKLAEKGFYDGTCFHRVIKGFMIQGGDPLTKDPAKEDAWGTGGPGYQVKAEFNDHPHLRGVISAGSQFFICHGNPSFLDHQYTTFGKLIKGDDVLEKIATTPTHPQDRPDKRVGIISIKIVPLDAVK